MTKTGAWYLQAEGIKVNIQDRHLFSLEKFELYRGDKVGLVGLNGSGKTTLLNVLYGEISPEEGMVNKRASISYFLQFEDALLVTENGRMKKEFQIGQLSAASTVSGGENTRIRLATALSVDADVVFVDEPTSNLDMKGITLLKEKLMQTETFMLITHDRMLLESLCNRIVEIEDNKVTVYEMGYEQYRQVKAENRKRQKREYEAYIKEKDHLQSVYLTKKKKAADIGKVPKKLDPREARLRNFLAARPYDCKQLAMERQAKAALSRIEHLEVKEKPKELPSITIDFSLTNPPENRRVIKVEHLNCSFGKKEVINDACFWIRKGAKVAVMGRNGAGKTTLLNAITQEREGVYIVPKAKLGYFHQQFEQLDLNQTVLENIMRDSIQTQAAARTVLARLLLNEQFMKEPAGKLSGGEKVKLAIGKLLVSDANVLLLDEPTNYLDLPSVEALTAVLKEYEGTILFVSHDEALVNELATNLLLIENKQVAAFDGSLQEYQERQHNTAQKEQAHIQIQALEMRLVELISHLSVEKEKQKLEEEYEQIMEKLSALKKQFR